MTTKRQLWIDTQGQPAVTTTPKGERNAVRWGWIRAVAMTKAECDLLALDPKGPDEREALNYTDIANRAQAETGRSIWPSTVKAIVKHLPIPRPVTVTDEAVETARREPISMRGLQVSKTRIIVDIDHPQADRRAVDDLVNELDSTIRGSIDANIWGRASVLMEVVDVPTD